MKCPKLSFNSIANVISIEQAPLKIIAVDPNSKEKKTYEI